MSARSLALHLHDFSVVRPRAASFAALPSRDLDAELVAARAAGFAEGHAAGCRESQARYDQILEDEQVRVQNLIVLSRSAWVEETADRLARSFEAESVAAEEALAADIARILAAIAVVSRRAQAVEDMLARLGPLLRDESITRLEISGPDDLADALSARLGSRLDVRRGPGNGELKVRVDRTMLSTRLDSWRDILLAAVEE